MRKISLFLLVVFLSAACSTTPIIELRSDDSIILNGNSLTIEDLETHIKCSEVIIHTDKTLSYDRLMLVMKELEKIGVEKVDLKTIEENR
jgi:biopolymer transport protein ExbD